MKKFKIRDTEYNMCSSWYELTVDQWIAFNKWKAEVFTKDKPEAEKSLTEVQVLEIIEMLSDCNDTLRITTDVYYDLCQTLQFIKTNPRWPLNDSLMIGEQEYAFLQLNQNKIEMGEYISIKTYQEQIKSEYDQIPYILSIILRPIKREIEPESGLEVIKFDEFTTENLQYRVQAFRKLKAVQVLGHIDFFLAGKEPISTTPSLSSSSKKVENKIASHQ